ncbi:MAG: hypothetical protein AB1Z23_00235, partial [Eubacteriales bacterium]
LSPFFYYISCNSSLSTLTCFRGARHPIILIGIYVLRFKRVKFIEIYDVKEAKETRIRAIEPFLILIYIFEIPYIIYEITMNAIERFY